MAFLPVCRTQRALTRSLANLEAAWIRRQDFSASTSTLKQTPLKNKRYVAKDDVDAVGTAEGIAILKSVEIDRPDNAFEIEIVTRVDKSSPPLRGRTALPRDARRKLETIIVFAEPGTDAYASALSAGADHVGSEDLIDAVASGRIVPTKVLASPKMLPVITPKLGRFLGQKGLMPNVKRGTATEELGRAVGEAKGLMDWREDKQGHVRAAIGRVNFPVSDVENNIRHFVQAVRTSYAANQPENSKASKASPIRRVMIATTQGPSLILNDVVY